MRPLRWIAHRFLDRVDADIARWFVDDGTLANADREPWPHDSHKHDLRNRRLRAVRWLERFGGHDPHPTLTRPHITQRREQEGQR